MSGAGCSPTAAPDFADLVEQVAARIEAQVAADARDQAMAAQGDPMRWRRAELLWPQFAASPLRTKG